MSSRKKKESPVAIDTGPEEHFRPGETEEILPPSLYPDSEVGTKLEGDLLMEELEGEQENAGEEEEEFERFDPVTRNYCREMARENLLTRKEECELGEEIEECERRMALVLFGIPEAVTALEKMAFHLAENDVRVGDIVRYASDYLSMKEEKKQKEKVLGLIHSFVKLCEENLQVQGQLALFDVEDTAKELERLEQKMRTLLSSLALRKNILDEILAEVRQVVPKRRKRQIESRLVQVARIKRRFSKARDKLVRANLRLVLMTAKKFANCGTPMYDLIQEGNIGLVRAADKFEYRRGYKFSTFSTHWIKQNIHTSIANKGKTIRIPVHVTETINTVNRVREEIQRETGRDPTIEEIAERAGITEAKVMRCLKIYQHQQTVSMETRTLAEEEVSLGDTIADGEETSPETKLMDKMKEEEIGKLIMSLPEREGLVITKRFGLAGEDEMSLKDIAKEMGLTREGVRQIQERALRNLKKGDRYKALLGVVNFEPRQATKVGCSR